MQMFLFYGPMPYNYVLVGQCASVKFCNHM